MTRLTGTIVTVCNRAVGIYDPYLLLFLLVEEGGICSENGDHCSRLVVVIVSNGLSNVANATRVRVQNVVCTNGEEGKCARVQASVQGC